MNLTRKNLERCSKKPTTRERTIYYDNYYNSDEADEADDQRDNSDSESKNQKIVRKN